MAVIIPHDNDLKPGTWKGGLKYDDTRTALFCCPNGHVGTLTTHRIASDGKVTPSVVCPYEGCNFHEYITLEGWTP